MTKGTKSFFILSSSAVFLAVLAMGVQQYKKPKPVRSDAAPVNASEQELINGTLETKLYSNDNLGIQFKYPAGWAVSTGTENNYRYIHLLPPQADEPISIHVGTEYYGLTGIPSEPISINNYEGFRVDDSLFGLSGEAKKYTFDLSNNTAQLNEFKELLGTVQLF